MNSASIVDRLYEKFVHRYGADESVRKIIRSIIVKAHKAKNEKIKAKLGDTK